MTKINFWAKENKHLAGNLFFNHRETLRCTIASQEFLLAKGEEWRYRQMTIGELRHLGQGGATET